MFLSEIKNLEIFRPKCDSTKEVLHAIGEVEEDLSPVLPYLNAELGGWDYDAVNHVLLLKLSEGKWITLHPHKIAIRGCRDLEEAHALMEWSRGQVNDVFDRRQAITPRHTSQAGLQVLELLKHLPRTNCRACGYLTCMAYAAALREGETTPQYCPPLWEDDYQPRREQLLDYLNRFGWRALDEW